jgi:hypothetical protein
VTQIYRAAFWTAVAIAFVMALLPQPPQLPGAPSDKVQHIGAFATLAGLSSAAYPSAPSLRLLAGLSAFGAVIEALQAIPTLHRDADPIDWIADTCASALILAAAHWWRSKQERSRR